MHFRQWPYDIIDTSLKVAEKNKAKVCWSICVLSFFRVFLYKGLLISIKISCICFVRWVRWCERQFRLCILAAMAREQIVPGVLRLNNKLFFFCRCTIKNIYISSRCHFPSSNAKPALMWENLPMTHWCLLTSLLSGSTYSSRNCLEEIFLSDQRRSTSSSGLNGFHLRWSMY